MKTSPIRITLTVVAFTLVCNVQAQYTIDWFAVAGGGGTTDGSGYTLSGTVGQIHAGTLSGGNFSFTGGFWSIVEIIGSPQLSIAFNAQPSTVKISWPRPAAGFVLDQSTTLLSPPAVNSWTQVPFPYQTNATHISITVPAPSGNKFYRLRRP